MSHVHARQLYLTSANNTDQTLDDHLRAIGYSAAAIAAADVLLAQTRCADASSLGCRDVARELARDRAGALEFRVDEGYSLLLASIATGLPIRLGTQVDRIRWLGGGGSGGGGGGGGVEVRAGGESLVARRCIITIPVAVLQVRCRPLPRSLEVDGGGVY